MFNPFFNCTVHVHTSFKNLIELIGMIVKLFATQSLLQNWKNIFLKNIFHHIFSRIHLVTFVRILPFVYTYINMYQDKKSARLIVVCKHSFKGKDLILELRKRKFKLGNYKHALTMQNIKICRT